MYVEKHPYFQNTCARYPKRADKRTFQWIAKMICLWDMKICGSFVKLVEGGMTVYDWPVWALLQLKNFKNTHSQEEINARLLSSPLFDEWDLKNMNKYLAVDGVDEILNRELFLPCFNRPSSSPIVYVEQVDVNIMTAEAISHQRKKRKI
jgi:hypothetical protein